MTFIPQAKYSKEELIECGMASSLLKMVMVDCPLMKC